MNKIENRITSTRKTGFCLQLLISETMKLLGNTSRITKNENSENVLYLEINGAILVHCNIVNNNYQENSRVLFRFVPNKSFAELLDISP